jgi:hypothetical protein
MAGKTEDGVSRTTCAAQVRATSGPRPFAGRAGWRRNRGRGRGPVLAALVISGAVTAGALGPASAAAAESRFHSHFPHRRFPSPDAAVPTTGAPLPTTTTAMVTLPAPAAPPSAPADTCVKPGWAQAVQGAPTSFAAGSDGAYVWYDPDGGWALRFTHADPQDTQIFAGSLSVTSGQFLDLTSLSDRPRDIVALSPNKRTIYFRFVDFGVLDGLNFATHCTKAFAIRIYEGGSLLPANAVHLGSSSANPPSDPFKVARGALLSAKAKEPATK